MKPILSDTIREKINAVCRNQEDIRAVYLFGSHAKGEAGRDSDMDVAVFVQNRSQLPEMALYTLFSDNNIKFPNELDLTSVDQDSSPLLLYQVIKYGQPIYEKSVTERIELEADILHRYYDNQHMRMLYRNYLEKSFQEGTYAH